MALHVVDVGKEYASLGDLSSKSSNDLIANIRITLFKQGDEATKRVEELARKENIPVQCKVIEGNPAKDILKTAKEGQMDLIVLGSIGVTGLDKFLLGSVAEKVIHNSRVPVMVVS
jgi:nucleotide-binding universal stress UspA family protein